MGCTEQGMCETNTATRFSFIYLSFILISWSSLFTLYIQVSGMDIGKIMDSWTNQMGFPVVYVSQSSRGIGKAVQKHFLLNLDNQNKNQTDRG